MLTDLQAAERVQVTLFEPVARQRSQTLMAANAAAPVLDALLWQAFGSYDALVICALVGALVVAACY